MLIVPKVDEKSYPISEELGQRIRDKLEIQLIGIDVELSFENAKRVISQFDDLKVLILHMSEELVCFDFVASHKHLREAFIRVLSQIVSLSNEKNLEIYLLTHLMQPMRFYKHSEGKKWLQYYLDMIEGTNVNILIENSLPDIRFSQPYDTALSQLLELKHPKLFMCLDICHWFASCNLLQRDIEFPKELVSRIKSVHFSATLNNDGWLYKKETHGRVHPSIDSCERDLQFLKKLGVDFNSTFIVAEINESDYVLRPDLITELNYLDAIKDA